MNELKAPSLNSLLGSDRGSTDSLLAESLIDVEEVRINLQREECGGLVCLPYDCSCYCCIDLFTFVLFKLTVGRCGIFHTTYRSTALTGISAQ